MASSTRSGTGWLRWVARLTTTIRVVDTATPANMGCTAVASSMPKSFQHKATPAPPTMEVTAPGELALRHHAAQT